MIVIVILIALTIVIITTLIFTNESWTNYSTNNQILKKRLIQNTPYNNYINSNPYKETDIHIRKEYRLPYRYPVGFFYENPVPHIASIHSYDINS
jgi:hypothetical protein